MSKTDTTTQDNVYSCEFVNEVEAAAKEARRKCTDIGKGPLAAAYAQVSLLLRQLVFRHIPTCAACKQDDARLRNSTSGQYTAPPTGAVRRTRTRAIPVHLV